MNSFDDMNLKSDMYGLTAKTVQAHPLSNFETLIGNFQVWEWNLELKIRNSSLGTS